jgi:Pyridoxamine 5'-phosphate oxidase
MDQQTIDDELTQAGAQDLLTTPHLAHVAYSGKDGTPRVIPIGFFWTGEQVVVCTASTAPKVAALSARPEVAVTIDAGDTPDTARSLSIRGQATVEIVDGVPEEYLAGAGKFLDEAAQAAFEQGCRQLYGQMARIAITPRWARYYDYGGGRAPQFLVDLAAKNLT